MDEDNKGLIYGFLLLGVSAGIVLGHLMTQKVYQDHAIKAGVGYYDPQTGTFKYRILE